MPHPLGLEDVPDAQLVKPGLVAVTQPVRSQAGAQRQPARERDRLTERPLRAGAAFRTDLVLDERAVLPELDSAVTAGPMEYRRLDFVGRLFCKQGPAAALRGAGHIQGT